MTVKILKQGVMTPPLKTYYVLTCNKCQTEFEYESADLKRIQTEYYGLIDCDEKNVINCPLCQTMLYHKICKSIKR